MRWDGMGWDGMGWDGMGWYRNSDDACQRFPGKLMIPQYRSSITETPFQIFGAWNLCRVI